MNDLIKKLAEAWGPPGFEHHIRELIRAEIEDVADEIYVDPLGNLICRIGDGPQRVLTAAHMDEIGLIVSYIDRQGFARFTSIGTLFYASLFGSRVRFENGTIATVGVEDQFTRRRDLPLLHGFYLDISTEGDQTAPVDVGDPGAFVGETFFRGQRVIGKSLDNRVGCAIQIEAMRQVKAAGTPHSVYFAFTVQEEVGTRGAGPAAYGVDPHLAIALDVVSTGDAPKSKKNSVKLGGGAAIKARDTGLIVPMPVRNLFEQRAQEHDIPYQIEVMEGGSTDGKVMQIARAGVPTGALSVPVRYVHTPSEAADLGDIAAVRDLLVAILTNDIQL